VVVGVRGDRAEAEWFGGVGVNYFIKARMVIHDQVSGAVRARGVVEKIWQGAQGRVEKITLRMKGSATEGDFGSWDLVPFRRRGELIYTKGADDLVGCAVILCALKELQKQGIQNGIRAIFTRAEEQGFIGTLGMAYSGLLPASTKIISIETSKALPGVVLGGGPVIRLGDHTSMFHYQGRKRIALESVHLDDVHGAVRFLVELVLRIGEFEAPTEEILKRFRSAWQRYGGRLQ